MLQAKKPKKKKIKGHTENMKKIIRQDVLNMSKIKNGASDSTKKDNRKDPRIF